MTVLSLEDPLASELLIPRGKDANFAGLIRAGFPVPEGFLETADSYADFIAANQL
jgi:phosphoenolpyruvate synthase/pyruvate phosphate dikinase